MTSTFDLMRSSLFEAQSQLQEVIISEPENSITSKAAKMAFMTAEICIVISERPESVTGDDGKHLRRALRAPSKTFKWLKSVSLEFAAKSAEKVSQICARCEFRIRALLSELEPDTNRWQI